MDNSNSQPAVPLDHSPITLLATGVTLDELAGLEIEDLDDLLQLMGAVVNPAEPSTDSSTFHQYKWQQNSASAPIVKPTSPAVIFAPPSTAAIVTLPSLLINAAPTAPSSTIQESENVDPALGRLCSSLCELPDGHWALTIYERLRLLNPKMATVDLLRFDYASAISLLRPLHAHFCGLRTLVRILYAVGQLQRWLSKLNEAVDDSDFAQLESRLTKVDELPSYLRKRMLSTTMNEEVCIHSQKRVLELFGKQIATFEKEIMDFKVFKCGVCEQRTRFSCVCTLFEL